MNDMNPADFQALATTNPRAALVVALSSLVDVTSTLVTVKLVVGLAQVAIVCLGIHMFSRADKRRHAEFTARHRKNMKSLDALIRRSGGRRGIEGTRHIGRRYP